MKKPMLTNLSGIPSLDNYIDMIYRDPHINISTLLFHITTYYEEGSAIIPT